MRITSGFFWGGRISTEFFIFVGTHSTDLLWNYRDLPTSAHYALLRQFFIYYIHNILVPPILLTYCFSLIHPFPHHLFSRHIYSFFEMLWTEPRAFHLLSEYSIRSSTLSPHIVPITSLAVSSLHHFPTLLIHSGQHKVWGKKIATHCKMKTFNVLFLTAAVYRNIIASIQMFQ